MIYHSPYPDIEVPDTPLTPFVLRHAERLTDTPALVDGPTGRTLTYGELAAGVRSAAAGLAELGFGKGDVFAVYSPNLPEYAVAFHAVARLGGIVTTLNPLNTVEEAAHQVEDAGARYLLTVPPMAEKAREAARRAGLEELFVFGQADGATPFGELTQDGGTPPDVAVDPAEDLVALPYSSGTTGLSKGVMLTHRNLVANLLQGDAAGFLAEEEATVLGVLPFFHIYGLTVVLNYGLYRGATIVTMPRFDLEGMLELVQEHRVTHANLVPPILLALSQHPIVDAYDLSSLKEVGSGAAPLGTNVARACWERIGCRVREGYGLTETSPVTHTNPADPDGIRLGSVGPPVSGTECRIVDVGTGEELGPGEKGEIWIRGPQVMKGYFSRPDATATTIDGDGWLHTGDIGYADEDGYLYVVDRLKELIKYKGYQVAPAELEAILLDHPAIADAAVIPSPDEEAGEGPKAFVVLEEEVPDEHIMAFVEERVAPYKKVRRVEAVDEIPKSASGKILRRVLVEEEREAASA